jgi:membrane protease YdiL (CAAX protease family)
MDERLQTALLSQTLWLGAAVLGGLMAGGSLRERLGLVPNRLRWAGIGLAVLGFLALSISADAVLRLLELRDVGPLRRLDEMAGQQTGGNALGAFAILGLLPALTEELLFRGFIQRILTERLGAVLGITGAAAFFGLAHADPVHSSAAFVLGLFLGTLAFISGSVGPAMLCHGLNNLLSVTGSMGGWSPGNPSELAILGLVGSSGLALWGASRLCRPNPPGKLQAEGGDAES